jgi:hypothetical protein
MQRRVADIQAPAGQHGRITGPRHLYRRGVDHLGLTNPDVTDQEDSGGTAIAHPAHAAVDGVQFAGSAERQACVEIGPGRQFDRRHITVCV